MGVDRGALWRGTSTLFRPDVEESSSTLVIVASSTTSARLPVGPVVRILQR